MKYARLIRFVTSVLPTRWTALAIVKPAYQPFRLSVLLDEEDGELHWSVAPG